jgi:hypothetical protein
MSGLWPNLACFGVFHFGWFLGQKVIWWFLAIWVRLSGISLPYGVSQWSQNIFNIISRHNILS